MSLTLNYDQGNARVEIVVDGLQTAGATLFTVERSTDQVNWTRVRGAIDQPVIDDDPILFFDYEYTPGPGVTNFYRVLLQDGPKFVGVGAHDYSTGSATPALPGGIQEGDLLVLWGISQGASFHFVSIPSDWGELSPLGKPIACDVWVAVKRATSSEVAPTISGPGRTILAQVAAFRNVGDRVLDLTNLGQASQPGPAGELHFPGVFVQQGFVTALVLGARVGEWTSVAASTGFTLIDDPSETSGNDLSLAWQYQIQSSAQPIPSDFMAVTGGTSTNQAANTVTFPYEPDPTAVSVGFTDSVDTPLDVAWLKNPLRPPRNMIVELGRPMRIRRAARSGLFDIKGRADPIEVTEQRRSRSWVQPFAVKTFDEADGLDDLVDPGETLLLHVPGRGDPEDCPPWPDDLPGGYIHVGDMEEERAPDSSLPRIYTAPVQKVAAPRPELGYIEPPESSS